MSILIKGMEMPNKKNGAVLIIYPDGKCAFEDGKTYQAVPVPPHGDVVFRDRNGVPHYDRAQTNADRIRAMTDEELAMLLGAPTIVSPPWCDMNYDCPYIDQDPARCDLCALDWLRQEAKD